MHNSQCPNCKTDDHVVVLDVTAYPDSYLDYLGIPYAGINRVYVKCASCELVYRRPVLDSSEKELLYTHYRDYEFRGEDQYQYFHRITQLPPSESENYERVVFLKKYMRDTNLRVLDVGSGGGVFLWSLKQHFHHWQLVGIEPTEGFSDAAKQHGITIVHGYLDESTFAHGFDLITLNHVVEHLDAPKDMLRLLRGYLNPGGLLYVEVPSVRDIGYLPASHDRFMCPHEVIYSLLTLTRILTDTGYNIAILDEFISKRGRNSIRILAQSSTVNDI